MPLTQHTRETLNLKPDVYIGKVELGEFRSRHGGQSLTMLSCFGPHDFSGWRPALIQQPTVIDGTRASWVDAPTIDNGSIIQIGYEKYEVCQPDALMHGNYFLNNLSGPRFYVTFEGFGSWKVRDRDASGKPIASAGIKVTYDDIKAVAPNGVRSWRDAQHVADHFNDLYPDS